MDALWHHAGPAGRLVCGPVPAHFDTRAVWWAQALKLVLGLALVMGVRVGLKAALAALFGEAPFADGVRYLCIALAGGVLWPMTFGFWSRLGRKRASQPHE